MRILSIDYGKKRTGLAVTDPLQIIANGLVTVATSDLMQFVKEYCQKEEVETIVVGEPRQPNGEPSENLKRVLSFVGQLKKQLPNVNVVMFDERYTSVIAHQTMIDAGLGKKARRDKALVDEISATIILQDYMESLRFSRRE